ncbi:MAG: ArsA-related P-loop ATPase [Myxococcota bacterium]
MPSRGESTGTPRRLKIPQKRRVLLCMGPGGVGKTTVSAAIGLGAAKAGLKVIVVTIDPSLRLAQALGLDPKLGHAPGAIVPVQGLPGVSLDCLLLEPKQVFDHLVEAYSPNVASAQAMLANPIYRATATHLSGAVEYAATARVHMLHEAAQYDLIVLDTPPTANAIEFLDAGETIREVIANPAARLLAGTGRLGMKFLGLGGGVMLRTLESMGGGSFIAQLGVFLREFSAVLKEFQRRAGDVAALLASAETGTVVTTAPTEFSRREAEGFIDEIRGRGMTVEGIVVNRMLAGPDAVLAHADLVAAATGQGASAADAAVAAEAAVAMVTGAQHQADRARDTLAHFDARYPGVPVCPLPRRDPPPTSLDELARMGAELLGEA